MTQKACATIKFDTGVAQGSITSPQMSRVNIFISALVWMLSVAGWNQGISLGLQIDQNQEDSSQDIEHGYQFHDKILINDTSISAETSEGIQTLLDVRQEFITCWCGMEMNAAKTFLLAVVIDKDRKRSKGMRAPDVRINSERRKMLD